MNLDSLKSFSPEKIFRGISIYVVVKPTLNTQGSYGKVVQLYQGQLQDLESHLHILIINHNARDLIPILCVILPCSNKNGRAGTTFEL